MLEDYNCYLLGSSIIIEFGKFSHYEKFTMRSIKTFKQVLAKAVDSTIIIEMAETELSNLVIITTNDNNKLELLFSLAKIQLKSIKSICCLQCGLENYNATHKDY